MANSVYVKNEDAFIQPQLMSFIKDEYQVDPNLIKFMITKYMQYDNWIGPRVYIKTDDGSVETTEFGVIDSQLILEILGNDVITSNFVDYQAINNKKAVDILKENKIILTVGASILEKMIEEKIIFKSSEIHKFIRLTLQ